jgi:hypothetical protein
VWTKSSEYFIIFCCCILTVTVSKSFSLCLMRNEGCKFARAYSSKNRGEILACGSCMKARQKKGSNFCPIATVNDNLEIVVESDKAYHFWLVFYFLFFFERVQGFIRMFRRLELRRKNVFDDAFHVYNICYSSRKDTQRGGYTIQFPNLVIRVA